MLTLIILFALALIAIILLMCYKAWQIRTNQLPESMVHEFGDKDSWLKKHAFAWKIQILVASKRLAYRILLSGIKYWVRSNRAIYGSIKKKFPHVGYMLGEKPEIRNTSDVAASAFISEIKEHQELLRAQGEEVRIETSDETITATISLGETMHPHSKKHPGSKEDSQV